MAIAALARAAASRQAVLSPCPTWLLAFVGLGAVSDVAGRSARLAGKLLSKTGLLPNADKVLQAINPLEVLGADPWEALDFARRWSIRLRAITQPGTGLRL